MPRSVRVHPDHRPTLTQALARNGFLTQGDLAVHLQIALSTVNNFFRGLNVSVSKFEQICDTLGLDTHQLIQPQVSPPLTPAPATPISYYALDHAWVGRSPQIQQLTQQLQSACRILILTGIAGIGKTALAERLCQDLHISNSYRLIRKTFDDREHPTDFTSVAAHLLEQCGHTLSPDDRANSQALLHRLIHHLQTQPTLLLIDSLELILKGNETEGWSEFIDDTYLRLFLGLLSAPTLSSRLLLTTQELPTQLIEQATRYQNFWICHPLTGLSPSEQLELFSKTGLQTEPRSPEQSYLERIGNAYEGHPLALRIIAGEIGSRPFFGNITAYWHRHGQEIIEVEQALDEAKQGCLSSAEDQWRLDRFTRLLRIHVRSRLTLTFERLKQDVHPAYLLLCEASVYRCPVPEDWWISHLDDLDLSEEDQWATLDALRERYLVEEVIENDRYQIRQHNLIRSLSLDHLRHLDPEDG